MDIKKDVEELAALFSQREELDQRIEELLDRIKNPDTPRRRGTRRGPTDKTLRLIESIKPGEELTIDQIYARNRNEFTKPAVRTALARYSKPGSLLIKVGSRYRRR